MCGPQGQWKILVITFDIYTNKTLKNYESVYDPTLNEESADSNDSAKLSVWGHC